MRHLFINKENQSTLGLSLSSAVQEVVPLQDTKEARELRRTEVKGALSN